MNIEFVHTEVESWLGRLQALLYLERWGQWKWLKTPVLGIGVSECGALFSQIDWMHVWPAIGLAITAIGTAVIGLWRYYRLSEIEIMLKRREADGWTPPVNATTDSTKKP